MMTLYGTPLSCSWRVLWMLEEVGVVYRNVPVHFEGGQTHTPEYLAVNPNGHIPTLDDDGLIVWESMAINLYLAERYGDTAMWPCETAAQARALQWSLWVMTEVQPALATALQHLSYLPDAERRPQAVTRALATLARPLAVLDGALTGRSALVTERVCVADINVASVLAPIASTPMDLEPYTSVTRWLGRCTARPAARRVYAMQMR